jgi:hypothetical protein
VIVVIYILLFSFREWGNMHFQDVVPVGYGYTKYIAVSRHFYVICMFLALKVIE